MSSCIRITLALAISAFSPSICGAAVLITPTEASQQGASDLWGWGGSDLWANVVNNSGLSGTATIDNFTSITHADAGPETAWTTNTPNRIGDYFLPGSPGTEVVWTLNLEQTCLLTDLVFWGYHFGTALNGNEARVFEVEFSSHGGADFSAPITVAVPLGSPAVEHAVVLSFGGVFEADTVRLTITDNQAEGGMGGGDRLGVGEFKFIGIVPAPEPSSSLLAALGLLSLLRRR